MTCVLLATGNPHKLDEVRPILLPLGIEVVGLDVLVAVVVAVEVATVQVA